MANGWSPTQATTTPTLSSSRTREIVVPSNRKNPALEGLSGSNSAAVAVLPAMPTHPAFCSADAATRVALLNGAAPAAGDASESVRAERTLRYCAKFALRRPPTPTRRATACPAAPRAFHRSSESDSQSAGRARSSSSSRSTPTLPRRRPRRRTFSATVSAPGCSICPDTSRPGPLAATPTDAASNSASTPATTAACAPTRRRRPRARRRRASPRRACGSRCRRARSPYEPCAPGVPPALCAV